MTIYLLPEFDFDLSSLVDYPLSESWEEGRGGGAETDLGPIYNSGNLSFVSFSFMAGSDLTIRLDFDTGN